MQSKTWFTAFWARPRQTWFRAVVFQLHLWAGLSIGLYALAIGLTGSVLVFQDELRSAAEPALYDVQVTDQQASLESVVHKSSERLPHYHVEGIAGFDESGKSFFVWMSANGGSAPSKRYINVFFNPHSGEILGQRDPYKGVLGWLANLHYFLLLGDTGAKVNGGLAAVLFAMCLSGVVIWWPGKHNWRRGFRFNFRSNWKCINWDLHSNGGFWLVSLIAILTVTGLYFEFPTQVSAAVAQISRMKNEEVAAILIPPKSSTSGGMRISFDDALEVGRKSLPHDAVASYLVAPLAGDDVFTLEAKRSGNALFAGRVTVYIDQYSGAVLRTMDSRTQNWGVKLLLMSYPIHFGTWGGTFSKCLWFLLGLTPGILFFTGFLMWWNRVVRKKLRFRNR